MRALKQKLFGVARSLRASLASGRGRPTEEERDQAQRLEQAERQLERQREQLKKRSRELEELRARLAESVHDTGYRGINPENVVWMLGSPRTGSTWLASMMEELKDHTVWREPYVGELFGRLYYNWVGVKHSETKHFILGQRYRDSWIKSIRSFILNEASVRFPGVGNEGYLVIREPNGSVGAPLLMEALPESRMVFLIRDPRDVVASALDAVRKGSWLYKRRVEQGAGRSEQFDMPADALVQGTATRYAQSVGNTKEAYEGHGGPKALVRYEDLRADTLDTMRRLYSELGIEVNEADLERAVKEHAWENVPDEEKGEGKFRRKASPGSWREDLTPEQIEVIERATAPLLEEFYPHKGDA